MKKFEIFFDVTLETTRTVEASSLKEAIREFKVKTDENDTNTSIVCHNIHTNCTYKHYVNNNFILHFSGFVVDKQTGNPIEVSDDAELDTMIKNVFSPVEVVLFKGIRVYKKTEE